MKDIERDAVTQNLFSTGRTYLNRRVRQRGGLLGVHPVAALGHVDRFGRVVEGPLEGLRRRVRVHLAQNLGGLVTRHAVDFLLVRPADGFVCGGRGRERESGSN